MTRIFLTKISNPIIKNASITKKKPPKILQTPTKTPSSELQKIIDEQEVQNLDLSIHSANNLSELLEENERLKNEVLFQTRKAE